jgi:glutamate-1-semialdehyde 2,1-aminomutase
MTLVARYNSLESVTRCFEANPASVAAVIVEPVAANMGVVAPIPQFLKELAALARSHGALLICDEVITGFRLRYGSISEEMGVTPDLIMLGKIIGGGLPIGAVGGRADLMDLLAPTGPVYQAGTLSGNPISVRAGLETLRLLTHPGVYQQLEKSGESLAKGLVEALRSSGEKGCVNRAGSLVTIFLGRDSITDADEARRSDTAKFATYFHRMLERGIYLPPSQFEAMFLSLAHSVVDIEATVNAACESLRDLGAA